MKILSTPRSINAAVAYIEDLNERCKWYKRIGTDSLHSITNCGYRRDINFIRSMISKYNKYIFEQKIEKSLCMKKRWKAINYLFRYD